MSNHSFINHSYIKLITSVYWQH